MITLLRNVLYKIHFSNKVQFSNEVRHRKPWGSKFVVQNNIKRTLTCVCKALNVAPVFSASQINFRLYVSTLVGVNTMFIFVLFCLFVQDHPIPYYFLSCWTRRTAESIGYRISWQQHALRRITVCNFF